MNPENPNTLNISIDQTISVVCEKCDSTLFQNALMMRKVSGLLTGTGQTSYIPIPVFSCMSCNHVNSEFLPREIKSLEN